MEYLMIVAIMAAAIAKARYDFRCNFSKESTAWYQYYTSYAYRYTVHIMGTMSYLLIMRIPENLVIGKTILSLAIVILLGIARVLFDDEFEFLTGVSYEIAKYVLMICSIIFIIFVPVPEIHFDTIIPVFFLCLSTIITILFLVIERTIKPTIQNPFSETKWSVWHTIGFAVTMAVDYGPMFVPSFCIHAMEITFMIMNVNAHASTHSE